MISCFMSQLVLYVKIYLKQKFEFFKMHFLKKGPRNYFKTNGMFKQIGVSSGFHGPNCRGIFFTIFNVLAWGVFVSLDLHDQRIRTYANISFHSAFFPPTASSKIFETSMENIYPASSP